jgi:Raf kinase inhibitor-like YbhB/YbcL family protein
MKAVACLLALSANAALALDPMTLSVKGLEEGKAISAPYAYCAPSEDGKSQDGKNLRPGLSWKDAPKGTQSFALIMVDPDVPTDFTDAGKAGKTIPASMKRQDFYHWAVVDIPATATALPAGKGRGHDKTPLGVGREGINDYATFMKPEDPSIYAGYDGPCPPWNDEAVHHYHFQLYALEVPKLDLPEGFTAKEAAMVLKAHIIGMAEVTGTYSLNAGLK